ncbi:MAG: hypothetical protein RL181_822, partial [Bacteroidota bacterium]
MITIYATPEQLDAVRDIVSREERLDEWVQIRDFLLEKPQLSAYSLIVRQHAIAQPID